MRDCEGVELREGDIVLTQGARYEYQNGLFLVTAVPGGRFWKYPEACLVKISEEGHISPERLSFWPPFTFSREAEEHNRNHAAIRKFKPGVRDWTEVRALFQEEADTYRNGLGLELLRNGESRDTENMRAAIAEYEGIVASLPH